MYFACAGQQHSNITATLLLSVLTLMRNLHIPTTDKNVCAGQPHTKNNDSIVAKRLGAHGMVFWTTLIVAPPPLLTNWFKRQPHPMWNTRRYRKTRSRRTRACAPWSGIRTAFRSEVVVPKAVVEKYSKGSWRRLQISEKTRHCFFGVGDKDGDGSG